MADAEITLKDCGEDSWIERKILGCAWWWCAEIAGTGSRHGWARSREQGQAKAEAAARELATLTPKKHGPYETYRYEVKPDD